MARLEEVLVVVALGALVAMVALPQAVTVVAPTFKVLLKEIL